MKYYPVNLDIQDKMCLVVGGGSVGARKTVMLLTCGARVTVVSPRVSDLVSCMAEESRIVLKRRFYESSDIEDVFLVFATTDNPELNRKVHADARRLGKLCNIADQPELCDFTLPAVIEQGDLMIAVSTSGKSPAYARWIRRRLEAQFGPEHAELLRLLGSLRGQLKRCAGSSEEERRIFDHLMDCGILDHVRNNDTQRIDELLTSIFENNNGSAVTGRNPNGFVERPQARCANSEA